MNNEQKKSRFTNFHVWLQNLYYVGTLITLFFIMAQVFYAKRTMTESSEWEKAKMTIENVERFKENLTKSKLYGTDALNFAGNLWPDWSTLENYKIYTDSLIIIYWSICDSDLLKLRGDFEKTLAIMDAFAYPIIMGYASETGSFQSVSKEYYTYSNYIMPIAFHDYKKIGNHAKLLYRLWRVRTELLFLFDTEIEDIKENMKIENMLCFDGTEITPASLKQYEKKLEKELEKIQKEIEVFRKNSLK